MCVCSSETDETVAIVIGTAETDKGLVTEMHDEQNSGLFYYLSSESKWTTKAQTQQVHSPTLLGIGAR